jgi:hypothetical protein
VVPDRDAPSPAADHSDVYASDAYHRGLTAAEADLAERPAPGNWMTVSVSTWDGDRSGREHFQLCRLCHWGRDSGRCPHDADGPVVR